MVEANKPLGGREEQFGVLVTCSVSTFLLAITDLEKKTKNASIEHLN